MPDVLKVVRVQAFTATTFLNRIAHWNLDGNDSSGDSYHGALYGPPTPEDDGGIFGDAYTFDGDYYMRTNFGSPHIAGAITVSDLTRTELGAISITQELIATEYE